MPTLLGGRAGAVLCARFQWRDLDARVQRWLGGGARDRAAAGVRAPAAIVDLLGIVDEMRLIKDADGDRHSMRRAAQISAAAHVRLMAGVPQSACTSTNSRRNCCTSSAATAHRRRRTRRSSPRAPNACVLHYPAGNALLEDGQLCLVDAGCEVDGYASDLTRTFPGQRPIHGRAARHLRPRAGRTGGRTRSEYGPDRTFNAPHDAATRVLAQGLIDLGLLQRLARWRARVRRRIGSSTCIEPATGSDSTCTTSATIASRRRRHASGETPVAHPAAGHGADGRAGPVPAAGAERAGAFHNIGVRIEDDVVVTATAMTC